MILSAASQEREEKVFSIYFVATSHFLTGNMRLKLSPLGLSTILIKIEQLENLPNWRVTHAER